MKYFVRVVFAAALAFVLIFTPLVAAPKTMNFKNFPVESQKYDDVLTLWHIDSFEGGVGSRGDFLSDVLADFSSNGIHTLVSSYSISGAKEGLSSGKKPDMISFGIGAGFVAEYAKSIPFGFFSGGELNGEVFAAPWCRGGYFLIAENAIVRPIRRLIVSKGEFNNPLLCLNYSDIGFDEMEISEPMNAYVEYLKGGKVLLGTQRDIWRLIKREKTFVAEPVEEFCDLYQYIAITTDDGEKYSKCVKVIEYLLSLGEKLKSTGMLPVNGNFYDGALGEYDTADTQFTLSPFLSEDRVKSLCEIANTDDLEEEAKLYVKYIK